MSTQERRPRAISKLLSRNDTSETGAHQAGMLIPRDPLVLAFFPPVDASKKNPRRAIAFVDDAAERWTFSFIYYNNRFFGGTRNEYRLTHMTGYLRLHGLCAGDQVVLSIDDAGGYRIRCKRAQDLQESDVLKLSTQWRVIPLHLG